MSTSTSRKRSWELCESIGLPRNPYLPELEDGLTLRSKDEIAKRAMTLLACVASSYSFPRDEARKWLASQDILSCLTLTEREFLESGVNKEAFQVQVESLYTFAWLLGFLSEINWKGPIPDDLVHMFPDLKKSESASSYLVKAKLASETDVINALDIAYCLDWAITESQLNGQAVNWPGNIKARRQPLEWALSSSTWDEILLDT